MVVSDDPLVRAALVSLLASEALEARAIAPGAVDDDEALGGRSERWDADVIVWDLGSDARATAGRLSDLEAQQDREATETPVVALLPSGAGAAGAFAAGARGLLLREGATARVLASAVRAVQAGLVVVDPALASAVMPPRDRTPLAEELTAREQQVLQHLSEGLANKEIAAKMHISDHTVKFHVNAILSKLGVTSRTEAVVQAAKRGLVIL